MKLNQIIQWNEFLTYFFIGATTTLLDWSIFWVSFTLLGLHYELALVSAYIPASIYHFISNKFFTFQCKSKNFVSQYSIYIFLTLLSLITSMGIMAILVNVTMLNKMYARILTTAIMLMPNYLMHKNITFRKKAILSS